MENKAEEMGPAELIIETIINGFERTAKRFKDQVPRAKDKIKKMFKIIFWVLAALFVAGIIMVSVGIAAQIKPVLVIGRATLITFGVILLAIAAPVGIVFESFEEGKFTGKKWMTFIRYFIAYQLVLTIVYILPWAEPDFEIYFFIFFVSMVVTFLITWTPEKVLLKTFASLTLIAAILILSLPGPAKKLKSYLGREEGKISQASLTRVCPGDIPAGRIQFFLKGKPAQWYFQLPDRKYELFVEEGFHDIFQGKLLPITPEISYKLINDENQVSKRNLDLCDAKLNPGAGASNKPSDFTPAPTPAPLPQPENSSAAAPEQEQAPAPLDNRKEYAVIVVDGSENHDQVIGKAMVRWLGNNRAFNAHDYTAIKLHLEALDYNTRKQLASAAKKIVFVRYKTLPECVPGQLPKSVRCWATANIKIINSDNGNTSEMEKRFSGESINTNDASQIALGFVFKSIENEFKNNM